MRKHAIDRYDMSCDYSRLKFMMNTPSRPCHGSYLDKKCLLGAHCCDKQVLIGVAHVLPISF